MADQSQVKLGRSFGQRRPPLSVTIKTILERYPDGQIFKELIQNADDAGARTVQFIIDDRQHGESSLVTPKIAKFQGPALLAYNDAQFTDDDWEGIQNLQQSGKAEDPFKVGKFGIGFNTVYHITDLPSIISGSKLVYLEPQETIWKGESGQLFEIIDILREDLADTFSPFEGICGFTASMSSFPGTLFRFPLRTTPSELSGNLYSTSQLHQLLRALKEEAKFLLLFLRSVDNIEVHKKSEHGSSLLFKVSIQEQDMVHRQRTAFLDQLKALDATEPYKVNKIITFLADFHVEVIDPQSVLSHWLVSTEVGSTDSEVLDLASNQKTFPWVGTALELKDSPRATVSPGGRIFCFLPMPVEASSPYPVHINSTFGLNDDRRTLKWPGIERENDPTATWNTQLISKLLPTCYYHLLLRAIEHFSNNPKEFYNALPEIKPAQGTQWEGLLIPLFHLLFNEAIVCSELGKWIRPRDGIFVPEDEVLPPAVHNALRVCKEHFVVIPSSVWDAFNYSGIDLSNKKVSPGFVRASLRSTPNSYRHTKDTHKHEILKYCLSDKNYTDLHELHLIPLANKKFTDFSIKGVPIYLCTESCPFYLLPNQESILVDEVDDPELYDSLMMVAESWETQLEQLTADKVAKLLPQSLPSEWQYQQIVSLPHSKLPSDWFEKFWKWVYDESLHLFVPVQSSSISSGSFQVVKLNQQSPVVYIPSRPGVACSSQLLSALRKLKVMCSKETCFPYLLHRQLMDYLNAFDANGILDAINHALASTYLNQVSLNEGEARHLRNFLFSCRPYSFDSQRLQVLKNLPIFATQANSKKRLYSVTKAAADSVVEEALLEPDRFVLSSKHIPPNLILFSNMHPQKCLLQLGELVTAHSNVEFLLNIVIPLVQTRRYPQNLLEGAMKEVLLSIPVITKQTEELTQLHESLSTLPFLKNSQGHICCPKELYDPSNKIIKELFKGEPVFPVFPFNDDEFLHHLRKCSLKQSVTPQVIIDIIYSISHPQAHYPQRVSTIKLARAEAVLSYLESCNMDEYVTIPSSRKVVTFSSALQQLATNRSWLPVCPTPPEKYPSCIEWKGKHFTSHFVSMSTCTVVLSAQNISSLPLIVGSQVYTVKTQLPNKTAEILNISSTPVDHVLQHFKLIIKMHGCIPRKQMDSVVHRIYKFLLQTSCSLNTISESIWLSDRHTFVSPDVVAAKHHPTFHHNLEPYLFTLPNELVTYKKLFGIPQHITEVQIISVLERIKRSDPIQLNPNEAWDMVMNILNWLTDNGERVVELPTDSTLYVPIQSSSATPELVEADKVVYTENDFLKNVETEDSYTLVHSKVHLKLAHCLGLRTLSKCLGIEEDIFEDAGQYEPLTVRLKNILRDYKDGLTIIKELLQNADDAEATEVNISYDARTHNVSTKALFFPGMADSHGPALVVHNNAVFSGEDFDNITKLAGATKESKPLKIGKFGIGFCSVYHITDIPSFVSHDTLCIFDPTLSYLKKEITNPAKAGKKVKIVSKFIAASNQLAPFEGLYGFKAGTTYKGTMFRFPFRTSASELSGTIYSDAIIDELVSNIHKHASKLLLFLQNVEKITFSRVNQAEQTPTMLLEVTRMSEKPTIQLPQTISHTIESNDFFVDRSCRQQWLVASSMETVECKSATASVACLLSAQHPTEVEGEVFCFLPLALKTGLPVHISSNFAVMNNRRGIWTSDGESKKSSDSEVEWNEELMSTVVPSAYHLLLSALQTMEEQGQLDNYVFYSLWPVEQKLEVHNPWNILVNSLYSKIQSTNLFYSTSTKQWLTVEESKFLKSGILSVSSSNTHTPHCVLEVVKQLHLPIVDLPSDYNTCLDLSYSTITEEDFIRLFFSSIQSLSSTVELRNAVLECLLEVYTSELDHIILSERVDFIREILGSNACVPCTPDGYVLKKCQEVIDCKPPFDKLFDPEEKMFPISGFLKKEKPLVHMALVDLGMINEFIPWRLLLERAQSIPLTFKRDKAKALNRVKIILQCMESTWMHDSDEENYKGLSSIPFLPVMSKPKGYFLSWKGEDHALLCGQELVMHRRDKAENYMANIAGSQISILNENSSEDGCGLLIETNQIVLNIRKDPTVREVTKHLQQLIDLVKTLPDQKNCDFCTECTLHIYDFLNLQPTTELSELKSIPCIWTGAKFVEPHLVAHNWSFPGPYLYSIPPSMINKQNLIDALEIKNVFDVNDIINALQAMKNDFHSSPVNEKCQLFLKALVPLLQEINFSDEPKDLDIYLPDSNYVLYLSSELAYGDQSQEDDIKFVHDIIPKKLALDLGVRSFDTKRLDKFDPKKETFFAQSVPFGQREKLTTRIQSILEDYPLDITVLKELLQNADDAKATKMYIILDKRKHDTAKNGIPSDQWQHLQGPALLVWNDSVFSEDDLRGIQDLGLGGKRTEIESIGQYGIGFNVVYHLTDCPSFITGGNTFCILDPHCCYAPGAEADSPGRRLSIDGSFWSRYKGLQSAYLREGFKNCPPDIQTGSLFRLPLRCTSNHIKHSKIIDSTLPPMTADRMLKLLHQWMPNMKQELLFLNHIREIQFMVIEEKSCAITTEHSFNVGLDEEGLDSRKTLCAKTASFSNSGNSEPYLVRYTLTITESKPKKKKMKEPEHWLLQQGIGDVECPSQQWLFSKRLKPQHGIAAPLSIPEGTKDFQGQVFCFLSLPVKSNLPVHINGKFILNSTRRGLWNTFDDVDEKSKWNKKLLDSISSSYAHLLCAGKEYYVSSHPVNSLKELAISVKKYYSIFPNWFKGINASRVVSEGEWLKVAEDVYRKITLQNAPVLGSIKAIPEKSIKTMQPLSVEEELYLLAFISESEAASSQDSKKRRQKKPPLDKSQGVAYNVEWYTLKNERNPLEQVYFFNPPKILPPKFLPKHQAHDFETGRTRRDLLMQLKLILQHIGMNITHAPYRIREHLSKVHKVKDDKLATTVIYPPETTPMDVYRYYTELCHHDQPCNITSTPFQNVANFVLFISYLLKKSEKDGNQYVIKFLDDPCGHSLLLTADCQLRCFDSKDKVLLSDFSVLFPQSLDKFVHPDMKALDVSKEYFYTEEDASPVICEVISKKLPESLKVIQLENADTHISDEELQLLWKCFRDDEAFSANLPIILQTWALLPTTDNQLFTCSSHSQLLPVIDTVTIKTKEEKVTSKTFSEKMKNLANMEDLLPIQSVLQGLGIPLLTEYASEAKLAGVCPSLKEHNKVLRNLLYVHQRQNISSKLTESILSYLIKYFNHIPFKAEPESLEMLRSLPFFRCTDNSLVPLANHTNVHIWDFRYDIPLSGHKKWMKLVQAIFLDYMGEWRQLGCVNDLRINHVSEEEIYMTYIFPNFNLLNEDERYDHLKYIRDKLYPRNVSANSFMQKLEALPCIADDHGVLKSVDAFCDHTEEVFINFTHFRIIPTQFRDGDWQKFLKKIGLKSSVTKSEFKELCEMVASGQHLHTAQASSVLLTYFISQLEDEKSNWKKKHHFLAKISKIPFLCCEKLPELSWIVPVVDRQRDALLGMTSMSLAAPVEFSKLLWTVRPIFKLPDKCKCESKYLSALQLFFKPSVDEIIQNILNVSQSPLADFSLFDKYPENCQPPKNSVGLLEVMCENFKFLAEANEHTHYHLSQLNTVHCIPVYQCAENENVCILVRPQLVIAAEETKEFSPFLHKLPDELMRCSGLVLLNDIGVSTHIEPTHLRTVLELVYQISKQQLLDGNTKKVVQQTIIKLHNLLRDKRTTLELIAALKPLYLPSVSDRMFPSTSLLYYDDHDYEDHIDTKVLEEEGLSLFRGYYADDGTKDKDFCALIPQELSPKKASEMCRYTFDKTCQTIMDSQLAADLKKCFNLKSLVSATVAVVKHGTEKEVDIEQYMQKLLSNITVQTIQDLNANIILKSTGKHLRSARVFFLIEEDDEQHVILYLDANISRVKDFILYKRLSEYLAAEFSKLGCEEIQSSIHETLQMLLRCQSSTDIQMVLKDRGVGGNVLSTDIINPELGEVIPNQWYCRLDNDIDVFHPGELVGYEVNEGRIILAKVIYRVIESLQKLQKVNAVYYICINDLEEETKVSALRLYKFLRGPRTLTEVVLCQGRPVHSEETCLSEAMQKIYDDLQQIWKLPDAQKQTAIRRLYLRWHPYKNPDNPAFAEHILKYLVKQVDRLQEELQLEDPSEVSDQQDQFHFSHWSSHYERWDQIARKHRQDMSKSGSSVPEYIFRNAFTKDVKTGKVWLEQAKVDLKALKSAFPDIPSQVCFMAHQVAEKALKGGLYAVCGIDQTRLYQHNLTPLANILRGEKPQLLYHLPSHTRGLEEYYLDPRYPNRWRGYRVPADQYSREQAQRAMEDAEAILDLVEKTVNTDSV